jgi:hypothetical protein
LYVSVDLTAVRHPRSVAPAVEAAFVDEQGVPTDGGND